MCLGIAHYTHACVLFLRVQRLHSQFLLSVRSVIYGVIYTTAVISLSLHTFTLVHTCSTDDILVAAILSIGTARIVHWHFWSLLKHCWSLLKHCSFFEYYNGIAGLYPPVLELPLTRTSQKNSVKDVFCN